MGTQHGLGEVVVRADGSLPTFVEGRDCSCPFAWLMPCCAAAVEPEHPNAIVDHLVCWLGLGVASHVGLPKRQEHVEGRLCGTRRAAASRAARSGLTTTSGVASLGRPRSLLTTVCNASGGPGAPG